ncbi:LAMI_0G05116g1_1 [Lachancea mirantina]|uniref:Mediator of RNA polymerase II transcription subunit 11 n=1 Tax=Lachancea mirantina TaxID=1230905 RepID=A0A1G4K8U0_9SACH|nr:LAMI_0G05116g1_1 [Lachancea mirantina]
MPQPEYINERLEALNDIDKELVIILSNASQVIGTLAGLKSGNEAMKPQFESHVKAFYSSLERASVDLRREIKHLDDNIGTRLLPINLDKKATGQDDEKLQEQLELLERELKRQ